jgi:hypothetical protein
MHHEYRRPCSRSRPCHERSTGDIKETPGGQLGDSKGPAGRHSEGSKISYMDQCTFGAVRPWGGRGAVRKRQSQNLGRARKEIRPSSSRMRSSGLQEGRRAASRLSPLKLPSQTERGRPWRSLRPSPLRPRSASPSAPGVPFFPFLFARLALTLGRAKAIPPRPKRRTKLRPAF